MSKGAIFCLSSGWNAAVFASQKTFSGEKEEKRKKNENKNSRALRCLDPNDIRRTYGIITFSERIEELQINFSMKRLTAKLTPLFINQR